MKNLLIMRHGKSDWSNGSISDFDRPLNERGEKASIIMGREISHLDVVPDIILSSPALRAKSTAKLVAQTIKYSEEIIYIEDFYFGFRDSIIKNIQNLPNNINRVLIIGHNPTWENLVSALITDKMSVTMPTGTLVSLNSDIGSWVEFGMKTCKFDWILCPKDLEQ